MKDLIKKIRIKQSKYINDNIDTMDSLDLAKNIVKYDNIIKDIEHGFIKTEKEAIIREKNLEGENKNQ